MAAEFNCLHCDASVPTTDINDGWCSCCGKKLPSSFQEAVKLANGSTNVAVIEPEANLRERLVCGGIIFALVSMLALVFIQNIFS